MSIVFDEKESVVFVGSPTFNSGTGDANAGGGATKAAWEGALNQDLTNVMGSSGEVLSGGLAWGGSQVACTVTNNGSGKCRITYSDSPFTSCKVGLIANCYFNAVYASGRYEVTAVDSSGSYIDIDLDYTSDDDCDVKVGGAFNELQTAIDEVDADTYSVTIYINKHTTFSAVNDTISFSVGGGNIANDAFLTIHGFHTSPGDMDYGGGHYQGPLDTLKNRVDTTKCVKIDANNLATDVVSITDRDNILFENIYFLNTDQASGNNLIELATNPYNIHFTNCKFDDAYYFLSGTNFGLYLDNCYFGNNYGASYLALASSYGGLATNCVFNIDGKTYGPYLSYIIYDGCLFYKGSYGLAYARNVCIHCLFYLQTGSGIHLNGTTYYVSGHSNIFYLAAVSDYAVYMAASGGTCGKDMVNCCVWSAGGQLTVDHVYNAKTGEGWDLPGAIEADPQFVDAANYDFRLKPGSPCLNTGKMTLDDGFMSIGAWQRKSLLRWR